MCDLQYEDQLSSAIMTTTTLPTTVTDTGSNITNISGSRNVYLNNLDKHLQTLDPTYIQEWAR